MTGQGGLQGPPALLQHALGSIVMDVVRGEHGDPAMAMFGVVPREERSAEGDRGGDVVEAAREAGVVVTPAPSDVGAARSTPKPRHYQPQIPTPHAPNVNPRANKINR